MQKSSNFFSVHHTRLVYMPFSIDEHGVEGWKRDYDGERLTSDCSEGLFIEIAGRSLHDLAPGVGPTITETTHWIRMCTDHLDCSEEIDRRANGMYEQMNIYDY